MTPTAELLTRVFSLLERASMQIGCYDCGPNYGMCSDCERLKYDIDGILNNEPQGGHHDPLPLL